MSKKTETILYIYSKLSNGERIKKKDIFESCLINETSFKRYIDDIRSYLKKHHLPDELVYDRKEDVYYLKKKANPWG